MSSRNLKVVIFILFSVLGCRAAWGWFDFQTCHYSCDYCWYGDDPIYCSSCISNRVPDNYDWYYYTCYCPDGTYDPGYWDCPACSYQCSTCVSSASNCLTCRGNYRGSAPSCGCYNGYFDAGVQDCQACNYKCSTCVSSSANCQSCKGNYRGSTPGCACITGYYDTGASNCQPCLYSCYTCSGSSNTCTSCSASLKRFLSSSTCPCMAGYYEQTNQQCLACNYKCATCVSSASNCLTCPAGSNRASTPACSCSIKYYENGAPTCLACHYSCRSCTSAAKCDSCNSGFMRLFTGTSAFCVCPDRYYDPGSEGCAACDNTCFRCNGASSTNCQSCTSSAFRVLSGSTCVCMTGYYSTSATVEQCLACTYSCLTCSSSASNCLTCNATLNRNLVAAMCPCKPTYFENSTLLCDTCHSSCATCTGKLACTTCIASQLTTIDSSGFCSCAAGTYWATSTSKCTVCDYRCLTCSVSATNCTSCPASSFRVYGLNTCNCIVGYYDSGSVVCLACHYTCKTCSGGTSSTCSTCDTATNRVLTSNSCPCKGKYYDNGASQCLPCNYRCLTCSGASTCQTCDSSLNRFFVSSNSSCQCLSTYYQSNFVCSPCITTCLTCSNGQTCNTCDSSLFRTLNTTTNLCDCQTGYYLNTGGTCSPCNSLCITCTAANTCLTCKPNLNRTLNTITSTCVCDTGYIIITATNVCNLCQYSCLTCQANFTSKCATCLNSTKRSLNSANSQCECAIGFYDDGSNPSCVACSYTCLTCSSNPNKCLSCPAGSNRVFNSAANSCYCAQHYYDNNITFTQNPTCLACKYYCSTCISSSSCTTCNSAKFRVFDSGNTQCICMVGYYDDGVNQKCAACSYKCQTCTNSTACLSCNSTWKRDTPATKCPCMTGYYDNSVSLCRICDYSCLTCTIGTKCLTCQGLFNRIMNSTTNLCSCATGYYDPGVAKCQPCSYSCLTCITSGFKCLTCSNTTLRTFQAATNSCPCNNGYYDNSTVKCAPCNYTCSTCGNSRSCLTCNLTRFRQINKLTGLCSCITSYYDNNSTQTCLACQSTCLTCINSTNCTSCDPNRNRVINHTADYSKVSNYFCPCLYKYYDMGNTSICSPCHFSCSYCSADKINNCLYCSTDAQRTLQASKKCTCNDGYYDTNATQTCPKCNIGCLTCWDNLTTTCFTCNTTNFMMVGKNTCYQDCPIYYFNNVTIMVCQLCQSHCIQCVDSTNCSECQSPMFLYLEKCEASCPLKFYPNSTTHSCQKCKSGCANCSTSYNCFKCVNSSYYVDKATTLCELCSVYCLTCFGPQANHCESCSYPLYLNDQHTCVNLSCSYGRYLDSIKGCVKCSQLYPHSLSCNISEAFLCESPYLLDNGECVSCSDVTGYKLNQYGECIQICGDGILIYYQCDDGNNLNGDGCSANCLIEQGWKCSLSSGKSKCSLSSGVTLELNNVIKFARENRVRIDLKISLPIRLNNQNFQLSFMNLDSKYYSYTVTQQNQYKLDYVSIQVKYITDIQNKSIQLSYTSSRRLLQQSSPSRYLAAITFTSTFNIVAFPPANFITTSTFDFYDIIEKIIYAISIVLVIFNFVIVPKKYGLHSITFSWIIPYIFMTLFSATPYLTEWISPICSQLRNHSIYFGFTLGNCCYQDSIKNLTTEVMANNGVIFLVLCLVWITFLVLKLINTCFSACQSMLQLAKYYLITLHLLFFCQIAYSSADALYNYQLTNLIDSINTSLALFIQFCIIFYIASLWYITYISNFQGKQDENSSKAATRQTVSKQSNETEHNDSNVIINLGIIKEISRYDYPENTNPTMLASSTNFVKDTKNSSEGFKQKPKSSEQISIQQNIDDDQNFLKFDYCYLYRNISTKSKYFLPMLMLKLFGYCISAATLQKYPFEMLCLHSLLSIGMLTFILTVKPFTSKFTQIRLITTQLQVIILQIIFAAYLFYAKKLIYLNNIQYYIVSAILLLLVSTFIFVIIEQVKIWKILLANFCSSCCLYIRLKGKKVEIDIHPQPAEQPRVIPVEAISQQQIGQIDAFYVRVLQKNALNRKYKQQRMIYDPDLQKNFS